MVACHALCTNAGETYIDADTAPQGTSTTSQIANRTMDALQGFKVMGTQKVERALPVGTTLTVIGEVVTAQPVGFLCYELLELGMASCHCTSVRCVSGALLLARLNCIIAHAQACVHMCWALPTDLLHTQGMTGAYKPCV